MWSPASSAWESTRTGTLEPCVGAVVTTGPWCSRSCPCTHLIRVQLSFWCFTCPSFFVLFLVLALFTCWLTLSYLACPLTLSDALSLDSHFWSFPFLVNSEASSILVCSPILDPKCWHECTCTDASCWPTLLDLDTNRDWKFQWVLEIHFEK